MIVLLVILGGLIAANAYMGQMKLLTPYAKNQQDWTTATLTELTLIYGSLVIYVIVANGLNENELSAYGRRSILVIF